MTRSYVFPFERVGLIRRHYRHDGGGERMVRMYAKSFRALASETWLFSEDADGMEESQPISCVARVADAHANRVSFESWVLQAAARRKIDFIHSHEWVPGVESIRLGDGLHSAFLSAMRLDMPLANRLRFHHLLHLKKLGLEHRTATHHNLRFVISPSAMCLDEFTIRYGRSDVKKVVIHNPIREEFFGYLAPKRGEKLRLLFIGSGWRRKGLDRLLRSLCRLSRPWQLSVIGTDRHAARYQALATRLQIDQHITWSGVSSDPTEAYQWAHVVVVPARYEPSGNVIGEALASGCFVVVSNRTGSQDLVNSETGVISDASVDALTDALTTVSQWSKAPARCRESVAHLTENSLSDQLAKVFGS